MGKEGGLESCEGERAEDGDRNGGWRGDLEEKRNGGKERDWRFHCTDAAFT